MFDTFITILTISQLFPPLVQHMDEFDHETHPYVELVEEIIEK